MTDSFFTSIYILAQDGRKDISSRDPAGESKFLARTLNIKYGARGVLKSLPLYDYKSNVVAAISPISPGFCVDDEVIFNWPNGPRYTSPVFLLLNTGKISSRMALLEAQVEGGKTGALT